MITINVNTINFKSRDDRGKYEKPNQLLATVVESLPRFVSLDISGTNLAGRGVAELRTEAACDVPGLGSRAKRPLQFLGLYETQHDACLRHDIPAKLVSECVQLFMLLIALFETTLSFSRLLETPTRNKF